jgi:hypothetical protein
MFKKVFFSFLLANLSLFGADVPPHAHRVNRETPARNSDVRETGLAKVKQVNAIALENMAMSYETTVWDGENKEEIHKEKMLLDFKEKRCKGNFLLWYSEDPALCHIKEYVMTQGGKSTFITGNFPYEEKRFEINTYLQNKKKWKMNRNGVVLLPSPAHFDRLDCYVMFFYGNKENPYHCLLGDISKASSSTQDVIVITTADTETYKVVFEFDAKTGFPSKRTVFEPFREKGKKDKWIQTDVLNVTKIKLVNGIPIPLEMEGTFFMRSAGDMKIIPSKMKGVRVKVDEKSIKLNQVLTKNNFNMEFPAGAVVVDYFHAETYKADGISEGNIKETPGEALDFLFKEGGK